MDFDADDPLSEYDMRVFPSVIRATALLRIARSSHSVRPMKMPEAI